MRNGKQIRSGVFRDGRRCTGKNKLTKEQEDEEGAGERPKEVDKRPTE